MNLLYLQNLHKILKINCDSHLLGKYGIVHSSECLYFCHKDSYHSESCLIKTLRLYEQIFYVVHQ